MLLEQWRGSGAATKQLLAESTSSRARLQRETMALTQALGDLVHSENQRRQIMYGKRDGQHH